MFLLPLQIIAFDELKTDYKNPIDQCNTLNPVSDVSIVDLLTLPLSTHALLLLFNVNSGCVYAPC